tara:strand:+ start:132 stop:581 length:450 start_codon:yes stop_codon:yes gene_type:complete
MMSKIFPLIFTFMVATAFVPQDTTFHTSLAEARAIAQKEDKAILMVFAGSDWCRPCMQFKKEILESAEFSDFAGKKIVLLYLDFPTRKKNQLPEEQKKQNEKLAAQYNQQGSFPHIVLLDKNEKVLSTIKFHNQTPADFINECKKHLAS